MEIYRYGNRLCMIMITDEAFTFERKQQLDAGNPKVAAWEDLMWNYQQPLRGAKAGEKWMLMDKLFDLQNTN